MKSPTHANADGLTPPGKAQLSPLLLPLAILLLIWLVRLVTLGLPPLLDSTEGRYAEISRQMVTTGDWIMPRLDPETPFWGKPVLWFWGTSTSFTLFGINEFGARFASWVFSLIAMLAAMAVANRFYDRMTAIFTGLVLSTSVLYFAMMGGVLTDPALLFGVSLAMAGFARCVLGTPKEQLWWGLLFFAGLGLGVLAKGLVGIIIPCAGIGLWVIVFWRWRSLARLPWLTGMILFAVIVVPWHLLAEWRTPGFLRYYIIGEHFLRYVDRGWEGDLYGNPQPKPKGMIIPFAPLAAMPWTLVILFLLWRLGGIPAWLRSDPLVGLLTCMFIGPILFFALADNVNITYCLPMLPAFAIVSARILVETHRRAPQPKAGWTQNPIAQRRIAVAAVAILLIVNFGWVFGMSMASGNKSQKGLVHEFKRAYPSGAAELVYYDDMEYTAQFYSQGKSSLVESDQEMLDFLNSSRPGWIAVGKNDLDDFAQWSSNQSLEKIGIVGKHHVFRKKQPS